jgi:flagellar export protein FliJ
MKPRAAWPLLAKKAKEKCDLIQVEVVKARERIKHLESSKERMVLLYQDYVQRSKEAERKPHSMAETLNFRSFMLQLQELIQRVDLDLTDANNQLAMIKRRLLAAEKKRIQMETLHEQDLKKVNDYHRKKEQSQMDAAGLTLFNLKA